MERFITEARELLLLETRQREGELPGEAQQRRRTLLQSLVAQLQQMRGSDERRRHLRVPGPLRVRFRAGEASLVARAEEMALGGFSLGEPIWVVAGQVLLIEGVRVGQQDYPLQVRARVIWRLAAAQDPPCAGLEFVDVDQQVREQIRTIFEALLFAYLQSLPEVTEQPQ